MLHTNLVGRAVKYSKKRGEVFEVVAVEYAGEFRLLLAAQYGDLFEAAARDCEIVRA